MIRVYLSGAMRGRPRYNFPMFAEWAERLRKAGYEVYSPAEADVALGFNPDLPMDQQAPAEAFTPEAFIRRDVEAVLAADVIGLLPDTEGSVGTRAEVAVAKWAGKPVFEVAYLEGHANIVRAACLVAAVA